MTRFLMRPLALALAVSVAVPVVAVGRFEATSAERLQPGVYRLEFTAPAGAPVAIYASAYPDRVDTAVATTATHSPVDVRVDQRWPRVYFHLKSAGETRVVAERRLPLEGAANFRDLGGYPTADGRHVRWGLVYRSNHLANLTAADYQNLDALGVKLVCDLRTDGERQRSPTRWQGAVRPEIMPASVLKDSDVVLSAERLRELAEPRQPNALNGSYDRMVTEFPEQYGNVLRRLAGGDLPSITHCTAGKDRTGVFSAILLTMLGVPRDVVLHDYMLTGDYMLSEDGLRRSAADWQKLTGAAEAPDPATLRGIYTMHPEVMVSTFATIDRTYGSFDGFVRDGLKLSDAEVAALRARLLW